jgi:hypothetical protein
MTEQPQVKLAGYAKAKVLSLRKKMPFPCAAEPDIIGIAERTLINCTAVEELSIALHDVISPPSFAPLLTTIRNSLGPHLRKLILNATLEKFPLILGRGVGRTLTRLTDLDISLAISRFSTMPRGDTVVSHVILPFINSVRETLEFLTISSSQTMNLAPLFAGLCDFPNLRQISLHFSINFITFSDFDCLAVFFQRHRDNIRHFSIGGTFPLPLRNAPHLLYETWWLREFPILEFPALRSLHIGINGEYPFAYARVPALSSLRLPRLVSLTLSGACLSHDEVEAMFSDEFDGNRLEFLRLKVKELNPQILNTLAANLPHLVDLGVTYKQRSVDFTSPAHWLSYHSYDVSSRSSMFTDHVLTIDPAQFRTANVVL